jgi:phosphatidylglycerol:prolipoprotein diacylglycerol transferase
MFTSTFDPVAFSIGSFEVRWYGIAYIISFLLGHRYLHWLNNKTAVLSSATIDRLANWVLLGVLLGGRLGYVLFYDPQLCWHNPLEVITGIRQGGMSFHGGCLGVIIALFIFSKREDISFFMLGDFLACVIPIGLFLGRIANFINGETFGRITPVPWGVFFPYGGNVPRHPSQLYEAFMEGIVLGIIIFCSFRRRFTKIPSKKRTTSPFSVVWGFESGIFLLGYSIFRIICEYFRQPDSHIGYLWGGTTWGQWLSLPLMIAGLLLIRRSLKPSI